MHILTKRTMQLVIFAFIFMTGPALAIKIYTLKPYVCYTSKQTSYHHGHKVTYYKGCTRSHIPCAQKWWSQYNNYKHFGKYNSRGAVSAALSRCRHATPRKTSSQSGLKPYVCYSHRTTTRTRRYVEIRYHGCRRSYSACHHRNYRHFGKYKTNAAALRAYSRCLRSMPKNIN